MKPELRLVTIVLVGKFDATKFSPQLLKEAKAVGQAEATNAQYELFVPGQAIALSFEWGKFQVERERVIVETSVVPYVRVLDLAIKAVREMAPLSTISKFGINVTSHYKFESLAVRDEFATRLVPPLNWGKFGETVKASFKENGDRHGGLIKVTLRQAVPEGREAGWLDVSVEPSAAIQNNQGVVIMTNDHFEMAVPKQEAAALKAVESTLALTECLITNFETSVARSIDIADALAG